MALQFEMLDENSGFVSEVPVVIPLTWRNKTTTTTKLIGSATGGTRSDSPFYTPPGTSVVLGNWNEGGTADPSRTVCKWQRQSFFTTMAWSVFFRPIDGPNDYVRVDTNSTMTVTDINIEIDWATTLDGLRDSYNPDLYAIGAIRFVDASGNSPQDLVKEGLVSLDGINSMYRQGSASEGSLNLDLLKMDSGFINTPYSVPYGPGDEDVEFNDYITGFEGNGITGDSEGASWGQTVNDTIFSGAGVNVCAPASSRSIPMYIKVWVKNVVVSSAQTSFANPEDTQQSLEGSSSETDPSSRSSSGSGGSFGGSTLGSSSQGVNTVSTLYGNSNLPFSSAFVTGDNFNNFISAGGGVISESGIFPNNTGFYIDKVRLSVEGSTMSVVEVVKFDASPSLSVHEKVFGYVLDESHQSKPVFCGFVTSIKRQLNGGTQEIVYECRDLSYYFDQFFSPSYYLYKSGTGGVKKTYDRVLKEMLNVAGVQDAIVSLPTIDAANVEWAYEPLSSILEWSTKYFGKYVHYIDRYGRLNIRATDSGSFIKNLPIPAEGTPIDSSYKNMSYGPLTDSSRSRSRVILTGDFHLNESVFTGKFVPQGPTNPDNANKTGLYWYYKSIGPTGVSSRFYYFVFKSSKQLLDKLLSDPSKNCEVRITIQTPLNGVGFTPGLKATATAILPIMFFSTGETGGKIIAHVDLNAFGIGSVVPLELATGLQNPYPVEYSFAVRYAFKSTSPIQVHVDTGLFGGVEVVKRPEFKKITGAEGNSIDDTALMFKYLEQIKEFYRTTYGGEVVRDGLDLDLELLGKVSITGTDLPSEETDDLIIYEIEYDVPKKITTLELSNRVYGDLPMFDVIRERKRNYRENSVKVNAIEQKTKYGHIS